MKYRREIDGLRAVAVIPVVLFHAGFKAFSGGFVGVDIFFVISGYLITSVILHEKLSGKFTLRGFYERRARRILPALFLVVALCIPFAWMWMWRSQAKEFGDSVIAVATFVSNILFWQQRDYFDTAGELKPLLHTWSLAVEEQYYLLFPIFLSVLLRFGKKIALPVVILTGVASFSAAWSMTVGGPAAAFFLLPTRAWEILIGASIALTAKPASEVIEGRSMLAEVCSVVGLILIGISIYLLDSSTPFPGLWALLPTAGTALIIVYASEQNFLGRVLGSRVLVGIGLLSYSAYLWHQPLLAFARLRAVSEPSAYILAVLCLAVLPLSFLSWKYVEVPLRDRRRLSRKQIFAFAVLGSICLIGLGLVTRNTPGLARQLTPNVEWEDLGAKIDTVGEVCRLQAAEAYAGIDTCTFGDAGSGHVAVLYGDSHARAIAPELDGVFKEQHIKGVRLSADSCFAVPELFETRAASEKNIRECQTAYANALSYVRDNATDVIVASRWTFFLYPVPGEVDELNFDDQEGGIERNSLQKMVALTSTGALDVGAAAKQAAVEHLLRDLSGLKKNLIVIAPVPEVGWDIAKLNWSYFHANHELLPAISTRYDVYKTRNRLILSIFDRYRSDPDIHFVWPDRIFCDTFIKDRCAAQFGTVPFYYDDDHLSDAGARFVVRDIMRTLAGQS